MYTDIVYTCICTCVHVHLCVRLTVYVLLRVPYLIQESNNNLDTATLVLYSSLQSGGDGLRGTGEEAAPGHATSRGAGDGITAPIPVVDQATGTEHSKQLHFTHIHVYCIAGSPAGLVLTLTIFGPVTVPNTITSLNKSESDYEKPNLTWWQVYS